MQRFRLFSVLLAFLCIALAGIPAHAQSSEADVASPDATVHVDGLACPFCAYGVEKKLDDLDATRKMEVQVEKSRILVAFREGKRASEKDLRQAVEKAGFTARKIEFADEAPTGNGS